MKTILLSFSEKWYSALKDGTKIYEHRRRFCNERVRAFIYIGKPKQEIVAEICLDKREKLADWLCVYQNDIEACRRIKEFMKRNNYAMKVLWLKELEPISLKDIQVAFPQVTAPLSFHDLDNKKEVLRWLDSCKKYTGYEIHNEFSKITSADICRF